MAGSTSSGSPSSAMTSAAPVLEDTARLPCLATATPIEAATRPAPVEMLIVPTPSPPVPTTSTSGKDTDGKSRAT